MKTRTKYIQRKDGEAWEERSGAPFKIECCDCGLVHTISLHTGKVGQKIGIAVKRDNRATAQRMRFRK